MDLYDFIFIIAALIISSVLLSAPKEKESLAIMKISDISVLSLLIIKSAEVILFLLSIQVRSYSLDEFEIMGSASYATPIDRIINAYPTVSISINILFIIALTLVLSRHFKGNKYNFKTDVKYVLSLILCFLLLRIGFSKLHQILLDNIADVLFSNTIYFIYLGLLLLIVISIIGIIIINKRMKIPNQ